MKLTIDLVERSYAFINTLKCRELDLRDNRIPAIENLAVTRDQNDTLDLTNNDIRRLDNFPSMPRCKHLLLSNNRISSIDANCGSFLPNLEALMLNNNQLASLSDLKGLHLFRKLQYLSLIGNPVTLLEHYRPFVIYQCESLKMLDFTRISQEERKQARNLFKGKKGKRLHEHLSFEIGTVPQTAEGTSSTDTKEHQPSQEEISRIHEAIKNAQSLEEITRLEQQLRARP